MERNILSTAGSDRRAGISDCHVRGITFRGTGQIGGRLCQYNSGFRHAHVINGREGGSGKSQSVGICVPDVFRSADNQAPGNKFGILPSIQHHSQPVNCRVRIAAPDAFNKGGNGVVVIITLFVVQLSPMLQSISNIRLGEDERLVSGVALLRMLLQGDLQHVQHPAGISSGAFNQQVLCCIFELNSHLAEYDILMQHTVQNIL